MALTRQLLKDMQLPDEVIEQIIAAHVSTVDALKAQRDEASAEAEELRSAAAAAAQIQEAFDAYRTQVEADQQTDKARELLRLALVQAGCNEQVLELLIQSTDPSTLSVVNGSLQNEQELVNLLKSKYGSFFAKPIRIAAPTLTPPLSGGSALTLNDLSRMSVDEINRNWSAVKSVLAKGAI